MDKRIIRVFPRRTNATPEEAIAVSRQMNEYLSNRIKELTSKL